MSSDDDIQEKTEKLKKMASHLRQGIGEFVFVERPRILPQNLPDVGFFTCNEFSLSLIIACIRLTCDFSALSKDLTDDEKKTIFPIIRKYFSDSFSEKLCETLCMKWTEYNDVLH